MQCVRCGIEIKRHNGQNIYFCQSCCEQGYSIPDTEDTKKRALKNIQAMIIHLEDRNPYVSKSDVADAIKQIVSSYGED